MLQTYYGRTPTIRKNRRDIHRERHTVRWQSIIRKLYDGTAVRATHADAKTCKNTPPAIDGVMVSFRAGAETERVSYWRSIITRLQRLANNWCAFDLLLKYRLIIYYRFAAGLSEISFDYTIQTRSESMPHIKSKPLPYPRLPANPCNASGRGSDLGLNAHPQVPKWPYIKAQGILKYSADLTIISIAILCGASEVIWMMME